MIAATAVVFPAPHEVEVRAVDCPAPGSGDVVIRVAASWISNGTEGSFLRGERSDGETPWRSGARWPFPLVAGYQKVGVVEWTGAEVTDLVPGELVFASVSRVNGMYQPRGGHVSPAVCARDQVWKLPPAVAEGGVEVAVAYAGLVLTQVGYNCGSRPALAPGEAAVVIGDGLVGHWAAQTLAWRGAAVTLVGRHPERLARFHAGATVRAEGATWPAALAASQAGRPYRVVVDTVGSVAALAAALPHLARDGGMVSAGFYGADDRIGLQSLRAGEQTLYSVSGWTRPRMDRTLELIAAGSITTTPLITHRFPVAAAAAAWKLITARAQGVLGVVLDWEG